jgi:hypothetical protein
VEGGGTFFVFYRERAKRTKKVGQNLQESGSKPSRKWVKTFKEMSQKDQGKERPLKLDPSG